MDNYTDESLMPFGIHKKKRMIDVPDEYLLWLYEKAELFAPGTDARKKNQPLFDYIFENIDAIRLNVNRTQKRTK